MELEIRSRDFPLSPELREHCERRSRFALDRFAGAVTRVVVRLQDVNGPKGGEDKQCGLLVVLRGAPPVWAEAAGADLFGAVDQAADRVGHAVGRELGRALAQQRLRRAERERLHAPG
jgi:ribosome-associated translation inhibitor RaiA